MEAYNIKSNEWFHVAPMNTRRSSVGVGVVGGGCVRRWAWLGWAWLEVGTCGSGRRVFLGAGGSLILRTRLQRGKVNYHLKMITG